MANITLQEYAKRMQSQMGMRAALIEVFASGANLLAHIPFKTIAGNAYKYVQESVLPGVAFRKINGSYTPGVGVINPQTENLAIMGAELDVDIALVRMFGTRERADRVSQQLKALAHTYFHKFIKGDSSAVPEEFDGLQRRLTGSQLVENNGGTGGALSLAKLDELLDTVDGGDEQKALIMSKAMRRRLTAAARQASVGGHIDWTTDSFGRKIRTYAGAPIIEADRNDAVYATLAFNEAAAGGGSTSTSIYCVRFENGYCQGIQNSPPQTEDLGQIAEKPAYRTRFEWQPGVVLEHPRCASRLRGITDAAVTA